MNIPKGTLVDLGVTILKAGERAPQVPADTANVNLEMKVKGILTSDAKMGEEAEIETPIGRKIKGRVLEANPEYTHKYGSPIPELSPIGKEIREILNKSGGKK